MASSFLPSDIPGAHSRNCCVAPTRSSPSSMSDTATLANQSAISRETLPGDLGAFQIAYTHIPELGGLRCKQPGAKPSINIFWRVRGLCRLCPTEQFHVGLSRLRVLGHQRRLVTICAEVLWWRCHRRIIADYLIAAGESVVHLFSLDHDELARLTPGAVSQSGGTVTYQAAQWKLTMMKSPGEAPRPY